jgi:hypothetical protein
MTLCYQRTPHNFATAARANLFADLCNKIGTFRASCEDLLDYSRFGGSAFYGSNPPSRFHAAKTHTRHGLAALQSGQHPKRGGCAGNDLIVGHDQRVDKPQCAACLDDARVDQQPLPNLCGRQVVYVQADRQCAPCCLLACNTGDPHRIISERGDEASVQEAPGVAMRSAQPLAQLNDILAPT